MWQLIIPIASKTQVNYLEAMINEENHFSSKEASVFIDPIYRFWLKQYYFLVPG